MESYPFEWTEEIKNLLDKRYEEIQRGEVKLISSDESKTRIEQLLNQLAGKAKS